MFVTHELNCVVFASARIDRVQIGEVVEQYYEANDQNNTDKLFCVIKKSNSRKNVYDKQFDRATQNDMLTYIE